MSIPTSEAVTLVASDISSKVLPVNPNSLFLLSFNSLQNLQEELPMGNPHL